MYLSEEIEVVASKFKAIEFCLDERARRIWAAAEARALGYGGIACVEAATGVSRTTIRAGLRELERDTPVEPTRVRQVGAGRKSLATHEPKLARALEELVDPVTRGDPMSALRWTCKSKENLAAALRKQGHRVSASTVGRMLNTMGYSLQALQKQREGRAHPDRNGQFEYINSAVAKFQQHGYPVVSVDTKKKELIGNFKNSGKEWQRKKRPQGVNTHDFPNLGEGKAIPYGVYDVHRNEGWVNVGVDHDTPVFAVQSIRQWWRTMGRKSYSGTNKLLITADAGGSNSYRSRVWKVQLQQLADDLGLTIYVCHFPPGTSKWNKIEHRLFCHITQNWRGRPLTTYETVVNLIGKTKTKKGLRVKARLDKRHYPTGIKVSDQDLKKINIHRSEFHGEWNYKILPRGSTR